MSSRTYLAKCRACGRNANKASALNLSPLCRVSLSQYLFFAQQVMLGSATCCSAINSRLCFAENHSSASHCFTTLLPVPGFASRFRTELRNSEMVPIQVGGPQSPYGHRLAASATLRESAKKAWIRQAASAEGYEMLRDLQLKSRTSSPARLLANATLDASASLSDLQPHDCHPKCRAHQCRISSSPDNSGEGDKSKQLQTRPTETRPHYAHLTTVVVLCCSRVADWMEKVARHLMVARYITAAALTSKSRALRKPWDLGTVMLYGPGRVTDLCNAFRIYIASQPRSNISLGHGMCSLGC